MIEKSNEIPIIYYNQSGEIDRGTLLYSDEGPSIRLNDGSIVRETSGVLFKVQEDCVTDIPIYSNQFVYLTPEAILSLGYDKSRNEPEIMYPPSTENWFSKVAHDAEIAVFTVHALRESKRLLLMITDPHDGELFDAHLIKSYEANILQMTRDWIVHNKIVYPDEHQSNILRFLDDKPPKWSSLAGLVEGVTIPNLSIHETMRDTMNQLVPQSFPEDIRIQIMAFLAWVNQARIPEEDPAEFVSRYTNVNVFYALLNGHLKCIIDNIEPPQYVKVMFSADKGQLKLIERPTPESVVINPWLLSWYKFMEQFPDWVDKVLNYANIMNSSDKVKLVLPVTKKEALSSRKYWSDRLALVTQGLFMRAQVNKEAIGLKSMVYVGGAHKWPHKHLEWSARLGYDPKWQHQIQIMVMPHSAIEPVMRVMPSFKEVDWEMTSLNLGKYDSEKRKWLVNTTAIEKSFERKRTIQQLKNEFDKWKSNRSYRISHEEARILDLGSWGIYLSSLELGRYSKFYNISRERIQEVLSKLKNKGLIFPRYFFILERLNSIYVSANGPPDHICSVARAFLKHAPSAQVMISNNGSSCLIVSRIPEDNVYQLLTNLPFKAKENSVTLETHPISSYAGYRSDLYQRLLRNDGTWDDDVSGLLSQTRLKPKEQ